MANGDPGYGSYLFNAAESERERRTANQRFQRNIDLQKYNIDKQYDIQDRRTTMDEWKFGQEQEDILGTEHITGTAVKNIEEKNIKKKKRDDIVDERTKRRYSFMDMFSPDKDVNFQDYMYDKMKRGTVSNWYWDAVGHGDLTDLDLDPEYEDIDYDKISKLSPEYLKEYGPILQTDPNIQKQQSNWALGDYYGLGRPKK